jgi:predicted nucleic acid-binding protein
MNGDEVSGQFFLDTNILVYSVDRSDPVKQALAEQLVTDALGTGRGVISSQIVQEFLSVAQRKFVVPMSVAECRDYLQRVLLPLCLHFPSIGYYDRALSVQGHTGYSLYDALIVTAAIDSGCRTLFTEDLENGRRINDLTIVNPFL